MQNTLAHFSVLAVLVGSIVLVDEAAAQQPSSAIGDTVATRYRPELEPLGVRVGSFKLFPQINIDQSYDDNIYATNNNVKSDFITTVAPNFSLESDWNNHALNFSAGGNMGFYAEHTREDFADFFAATNGRLDITGDTYLYGGGGFARRHEDRANPDAVRGREPTEYDAINGFARLVHEVGRVRGQLNSSVQRLDFSNPEAAGPGHTTINQDFRDRTMLEQGVRVGYQLSPSYEAFARVTGNVRDYDQRQQSTGINRDSYGYQVDTGIDLNLGGLVFGSVFVGYLIQDYKDFNTVSEPTFGLGLTWTPTGLTTVNATVRRSVQEVTQQYASSVLVTAGVLSVDHELLRNLLLNANVSISNFNYDSSSREDYYYGAGAGVRYLMNRNLYATLAYQYRKRDSDDAPNANPNFSGNIFRIGIEAQM